MGVPLEVLHERNTAEHFTGLQRCQVRHERRALFHNRCCRSWQQVPTGVSGLAAVRTSCTAQEFAPHIRKSLMHRAAEPSLRWTCAHRDRRPSILAPCIAVGAHLPFALDRASVGFLARTKSFDPCRPWSGIGPASSTSVADCEGPLRCPCFCSHFCSAMTKLGWHESELSTAFGTSWFRASGQCTDHSQRSHPCSEIEGILESCLPAPIEVGWWIIDLESTKSGTIN